MYQWSFVQLNWLFLCRLVVFYGDIWMLGSARYIFILMSEVSREKDKDEIRNAMGASAPGGSPASVSSSTSIQIIQAQQIVLQKANDSGKWYSFNGVVVGGALATLLAQVITYLFSSGN